MTVAVSAPAPTDAATVAPICTAEVASPEFLTESCEAFDSYGKREYANDNAEQDETNSVATFWHLLSTMYIPLVCLRLRKTFFGLAGFVRSILFGQFVQFLYSYLSPSPATWETLAPWLELINVKQLHGNKGDAWPPPTVKLLAIFTIVAFIVHPDGMTWIVLGKLRNTLYTIMESSTTCWTYVVADFGILTTIMALATFASMLFLVFVVHRTLASRTPPQTARMDRGKKKKRKGNHPRGGGGGRGGKIKNKKQNAASQGRPVSPTLKQSKDEPTDNTDKVETENQSLLDTSEHKSDFLPKQLTTKETLADSRRPRIESSSTVDTVAMMDDQSIESASVASAPSAASTVVSSRSPKSLNRLEEGKKKDSKKRTNKRGKKSSASTKGGHGISVASPSRTDYAYRPSSKNENSSASVANAAARSRSRGGGGGYQNAGRPVRSLADRMASPVPTASNNSLFSTPLSSPTDLHVHGSKTTHTLSVPSLQAPTLTSPSLFSHEPVTSAPLPNHAATQMGRANMFYNSSNFGTPESNRMTGGKVELAAFLAHVGLGGTVRSDLVEALDNVDSLYRLSDAQFELYNVSPDQKLRIEMMLETRRRARAEASFASPPRSPLPPPPGLTVPMLNQSATLPSPPRLATPATYSSESSIPSVGYMATSRTDIDFGSSPPMGGGNQTLQVPSISLLSTCRAPNDGGRDDEEIEAELQELGGQMIGSVLDFEG